jgi:mono-ADP-ribosyltransferase sirtuin 6
MKTLGSGSYASRLKDYPEKGICGLPELSESSSEELENKLVQLCQWWKNAKQVVVLTGAGISTSAGISDFRGPKGVWTLELVNEKKNKTRKRSKSSRPFGKKRRRKSTKSTPKISENTLFPTSQVSSSSSPAGFESAIPTLTHRVLSKLVQRGKCNYIITQNVDGLHQKSGLPRNKLSILHGCVFEEQCEKCKRIFFRKKEVSTISFQPTGNRCIGCNGILRDTLLDWEDALPEDQLCPAEDECKNADLVVALGTSLRIEPAGSLPFLCSNNDSNKSSHVVIINLQETPKDNQSNLLIRTRVDQVMERVAIELMGDNWETCDDSEENIK